MPYYITKKQSKYIYKNIIEINKKYYKLIDFITFFHFIFYLLKNLNVMLIFNHGLPK